MRQVAEARAIRIDDADVGVVTVVVLPSDACAVGRPGELRAVRVVVSQLRLIRAVSVHRPDFHHARARAGKNDARAVGRPSRFVVTRGRVRQARDARAVGFRRVNLVVAVAAAHEDDVAAKRRGRRGRRGCRSWCGRWRRGWRRRCHVAAPTRMFIFHGVVGQTRLARAIGVHCVNFLLAIIAGGTEDDLQAVGRPVRMLVCY